MSENGPGGNFDVEEIGRLMALMEEHEVNFVDVRDGDLRLRLRRGFPPAVAALAPAHAPAAPAAPPAPSASAPPASTPPAEEGSHIVAIKSPMVGTFYLKPKPDSEPYVKVGDRVDQDTKVCIIEAMKTFNEIPAGVSGVVVAVLAKNEEPVDFDRPLFKVDTSR
ncbi:MAG: acetyl-CoA carboxylase biotin carboxyl carrier protein [Planctomycetes bacterium]|nr:acetyl-CoA carboxylase biotin carboxyl carrier protein [Planctomycetota bacterium]